MLITSPLKIEPYQHQEFPKYVHFPDGVSILVENEEEEADARQAHAAAKERDAADKATASEIAAKKPAAK